MALRGLTPQMEIGSVTGVKNIMLSHFVLWRTHLSVRRHSFPSSASRRGFYSGGILICFRVGNRYFFGGLLD